MQRLFWIVAVTTGLLNAQVPDFSGVWKANTKKSQDVPENGSYLALIEQKDGRLTQINRITGAREQRTTYHWDLSGNDTADTLGGLPMVSTARMEGATLVVNARQPIRSMTVKYSLSSDGKTLTLEIASAGATQILVLDKQPDSAGDALRQPEKTVAESGRFKNIKLLGKAPETSLIDTMRSWGFALGKPCGFCHMDGNFPADDKPEKLMARRMVEMVAAINKDTFGGSPVVRCYTCHQGNPHPPAPKF